MAADENIRGPPAVWSALYRRFGLWMKIGFAYKHKGRTKVNFQGLILAGTGN